MNDGTFALIAYIASFILLAAYIAWRKGFESGYLEGVKDELKNQVEIWSEIRGREMAEDIEKWVQKKITDGKRIIEVDDDDDDDDDEYDDEYEDEYEEDEKDKDK